MINLNCKLAAVSILPVFQGVVALKHGHGLLETQQMIFFDLYRGEPIYNH